MIRRLLIILEMIKFEHTIFVLPFAYMGSILGSIVHFGHLPSWYQIGWITLAMVGARSSAMALNRLIDRFIDAKNPRTQNRAIPQGKISVLSVWVFSITSLLLLVVAASQLNSLVLKLSPVAVFMLIIYSYTKRFTWACHFILGITTALGPIGAWIATTGTIDGLSLVLFVSVALWISGFDILYACQDVEFDQSENIYSIPARFGIGASLLISSFLHVGTAMGLVTLFLFSPLKVWFAIGVAVSILILIYEHTLVNKHDLSRLNTAFFTLNGILSIVLFLFLILDVLWWT